MTPAVLYNKLDAKLDAKLYDNRSRPSSATAVEEATTGAWGDFCPLDHRAEQQWRRWATSRRGTQKLETWRRQFAANNGSNTPGNPEQVRWSNGDLLALVSGPRTDRIQAFLVASAQSGDGDAVVTLTVQLRPGLLRLVQKSALFQPFGNSIGSSIATPSSRYPTSLTDAKAEVLSAFQLVLMGHHLERRPVKIAANLLLDTRQQLSRDYRRATKICTVTTSSTKSASEQPVGDHAKFADELSVLRSTLAAMPGTTASRHLTSELAIRSWILEESNSSIAKQLSISNQVVNTRLHRLRELLKEHR